MQHFFTVNDEGGRTLHTTCFVSLLFFLQHFLPPADLFHSTFLNRYNFMNEFWENLIYASSIQRYKSTFFFWLLGMAWHQMKFQKKKRLHIVSFIYLFILHNESCLLCSIFMIMLIWFLKSIEMRGQDKR